MAHDKICMEDVIHRLESQLARTKEKNKDLKSKVSELEQSEKRLLSSLGDREKEIDKDRNTTKSRYSKMEQKLQRKKEKIR